MGNCFLTDVIAGQFCWVKFPKISTWNFQVPWHHRTNPMKLHHYFSVIQHISKISLVAINFIFPLILGCCHHPNWRTHIIQRGGPGPPTSNGCVSFQDILLPMGWCWGFARVCEAPTMLMSMQHSSRCCGNAEAVVGHRETRYTIDISEPWCTPRMRQSYVYIYIYS